MAVMAQQFGGELAKLLGLPKHTRSFTLRCAVGEFVTVECEYFPDIKGSLETALGKYMLVEIDGPAPAHEPKALNFDDWLTARKNEAHAAMIDEFRSLARMDRRLSRCG